MKLSDVYLYAAIELKLSTHRLFKVAHFEALTVPPSYKKLLLSCYADVMLKHEKEKSCLSFPCH